MIYVKKKNVSDKAFTNLLEKTKEAVLGDIKTITASINPTSFEDLVFEQMKEVASGTEFEGHVVHTGLHSFPDIIANKYFGAEVKLTTGDKWVSTGNSILESTRTEDVERIYIFFGKFGGEADIKYRLYQECLYDIGVTHSPRYKINMELGDGGSIFDKMGVEYEVLRRRENPIAVIKQYYRQQLKEDEELWWIDNEDDTVSPVIKPFRDLSKKEQEEFIVTSMILFPEMFSSSTAKFERVAAYLITSHNAVSASLRDIFTAGGRKELEVGNSKKEVSQILGKLFELAKKIKVKIDTIPEEDLMHYWRTEKVQKDRPKQWKELLEKYSQTNEELTPVEVFEAGL